jgi:hypothetical protein
MSARGANATGSLFAPNNLNKLFKDDLTLADLSIAAAGGAGGPSAWFGTYNSNQAFSRAATHGSAGVNGACGGGGSGGGINWASYDYPGAGAAGTAFSGGAGGGAVADQWANGNQAGSGAANGGAGGYAWATSGGGTSYPRCCGGGAGNPGGAGMVGPSNGNGSLAGNGNTGGYSLSKNTNNVLLVNPDVSSSISDKSHFYEMSRIYKGYDAPNYSTLFVMFALSSEQGTTECDSRHSDLSLLNSDIANNRNLPTYLKITDWESLPNKDKF